MKIARIVIVALILAVTFAVFVPVPVLVIKAANNYCEVTLYVTPLWSPIKAPVGLCMFPIGEMSVTANWSMGENATYTMLRAKLYTYPATKLDGDLVYYGDATSWNLTFDYQFEPLFIAAWGFADDNITSSTRPAIATIGGEGMEELTDALKGLSGNLTNAVDKAVTTGGDIVMQIYIGLIVLVITIGLVVIALWKREAWFYIPAGIAILGYGVNLMSISKLVGGICMVVGAVLWIKAIIDWKKH